MKAMMEITNWSECTSDQQAKMSHLYWMDGDMALAYSKSGTSDAIYFRRPMRIDLRGRKFVTVRIHPFGPLEPSHQQPMKNISKK